MTKLISLTRFLALALGSSNPAAALPATGPSTSTSSSSSSPSSSAASTSSASNSTSGASSGGGGGGGAGMMVGGIQSSNLPEVSTCTENHHCVYPSWTNASESGAFLNDAIAKAKTFVAQLNVSQKAEVVSSQIGVAATNTLSSLGYPGLTQGDGAYGVSNSRGVSGFPAALNMAATWDRSLLHSIAKATGEEFRGKGIAATGPFFNLYRTPLAGRSKEGYGADPYLGEAAYEVMSAFTEAGAVAVGKHFLANEEEANRSDVNKTMSSRTLHEVYLQPWERAVAGGMGGVMCAMNMVNGSWSCSNAHLLNGELKGRFNFQGFVTPDVGGQKSEKVAGMNGLDLGSFSDMETMVNNGSFPEARLDDMAIRVLGAWYSSGQDSDPVSTSTEAAYINVQGNHSDLIREAGAASITVLKNNGALPLNSPRGIALLGEDAGPPLRGPNGFDGGSFLSSNFIGGQGEGCPTFPWLVTPLEAIQSRARKTNTAVTWSLNNTDTDWQYDLAQGISPYGTASSSGVTVAETANVGPIDVCIAFANVFAGEGYDRQTWNLLDGDNEMIETTAGVCNNTIVVLNTVGSVNVEKWADHENITAIIWAGLLGQNSGESLADVLFGDVNPSGRLPFTWGHSLEQYPAQVANSSQETVDYSEGLDIDYRHFDKKDITPRWAFGHGLSYTNFTWSDASVSTASAASFASSATSTSASSASTSTSTSSTLARRATSASTSTASAATSTSTSGVYENIPSPQTGLNETACTVSFSVENSGSVYGCAISQLYLTFPDSADQPPRVLRGFENTCLDAGKSASVDIPLKVRDVSIWSVEEDKFVTVDETITYSIGWSSRDFRLNGTLTA